ncbi:unnamed protein product, partial [Prorocentrum cordatum]
MDDAVPTVDRAVTVESLSHLPLVESNVAIDRVEHLRTSKLDIQTREDVTRVPAVQADLAAALPSSSNDNFNDKLQMQNGHDLIHFVTEIPGQLLAVLQWMGHPYLTPNK